MHSFEILLTDDVFVGYLSRFKIQFDFKFLRSSSFEVILTQPLCALRHVYLR